MAREKLGEKYLFSTRSSVFPRLEKGSLRVVRREFNSHNWSRFCPFRLASSPCLVVANLGGWPFAGVHSLFHGLTPATHTWGIKKYYRLCRANSSGSVPPGPDEEGVLMMKNYRDVPMVGLVGCYQCDSW